MRVGIIAFLQESNTFIGRPTEIEHFEQDLLLCGKALAHRMETDHHEVSGFLTALHRANVEAVPIFGARALPYGIITAGGFARLESLMMTELKKVMPLDGLLVALHGATVSEAYPDVDGHLLELLRDSLGTEKPIIVTIDPHADLSHRRLTEVGVDGIVVWKEIVMVAVCMTIVTSDCSAAHPNLARISTGVKTRRGVSFSEFALKRL